MRRTEMLQEMRKMRFMKIKLRFEGVYLGWNESRLTQEEANVRRSPPVQKGDPFYEQKKRTKRSLIFIIHLLQNGGADKILD